MKNRALVSTLALVSFGAALGFGLRSLQAQGIPDSNPLYYSGTLLENGQVVNGTRPIGVNLWADATSQGSPLCTTVASDATVVAGRFRVPLAPSCKTALNQNNNAWVEVIDGTTSLGRSKIGAVPYAVEADHAVAATSAVDGGALQTALAQVQSSVSALQSAPTVVHGDTLTAADDSTTTGGFAAECLTTGFGGGSGMLHACTLAANRKCQGTGYTFGIFVGESDGTYLSIICVK